MTDSPTPADETSSSAGRDPAEPLGAARHGTSAHGSAGRKVTIESDGEELVDEELIIERAPGGGQSVPSAADLAAAQHPEDD